MIAGYPFSPNITESANCGPTVLATVLGVDTNKAIELMDEYYENGWHGYTNIGHIRAVLEHFNISMTKIKGLEEESKIFVSNNPMLIFIQIEGDWMGKGWRSEYNHTHWLMQDKCKIMDVNNPLDSNKPKWVNVPQWFKDVLPIVLGNDGTGWHIRSAYLLKERE